MATVKWYTGNFFGAEFVGHHYEPSQANVTHWLSTFAHKHEEGQKVRARIRGRKSVFGSIIKPFYSTDCNWERFECTGGTIKCYWVQDDNGKVKMFAEHEIKEAIN